ncbi:PTS sugar transporter subunit IIB [Leuconostoc rapi]|uniref:PTS sugar transporter subunit IIB n=1 Tax=Leuconostoc rapi TaxID=1406906 RepID=UPI001956AC11|nr:PTS sugar transporter subunit IIB [Leuconostoc rapi]MBM7434818.1 PTS system cellobiose-specific IIB component [Leuconostoc rapi]
MATKRIMLVCAAGMSTSLLVASMKKSAVNQGKDYDIFAIAISDLAVKLKDMQPDIVLLGPQVSYLKDEIKNQTDIYGIPMAVMDMMDYGTMKGANILKTAEALLKHS